MVINGESEKPSTLKNIFGRLKEATGCPKTEVPISARMTSIVQKMAVEKNASFYGPEGYFCRRQKLIAAWLKYSLWIGQHNFPAFLTSFLV